MTSELEEMRAQIAKLTSENNSLKQLNVNLERKLDSVKSNGGVRSDPEMKKKLDSLTGVDMAPLVSAKKHLEDRLKEVVFLLKSSDADITTQLQLDHQQAMVAVRKKNQNSVDNDTHQMFASPGPESPLVLPADSPKSLKEIVDSDSETVLAAEDNPVLPSPSNKPVGKPPYPTIHNTLSIKKIAPSFTLSSHTSQIRSLAVFSDSLLSLSQEGTIQRWILPAITAESDTMHKSTNIYQCNDAPFTVQWIDKELFVTASDNRITLWSLDGRSQQQLQSSPIKQISVNDPYIAALIDSTVKVLTLQTSKARKWKETTINVSAPEAICLVGNKLHVKVKNAIEVFDLPSGNYVQTNPFTAFLNGPVTKLNVTKDFFSFVTRSEAVVYDRANKAIVLEERATGVSDILFTKNRIIILRNNGSVGLFQHDGTPVSRLSHYDSLLEGEELNDLAEDDKEFFNSSHNVGAIYEGEYILTGGEDAIIHGYKI